MKGGYWINEITCGKHVFKFATFYDFKKIHFQCMKIKLITLNFRNKK